MTDPDPPPGRPVVPAVPAARRLDPASRAAAGAAARSRVPPDSHAAPTAPAGRDPLAVLSAQAASRVCELVPIRHGRMLTSPLAFYRGAAAIMAADLAPAPDSGLVSQLCGDAHLSNFGLFASPERRLVFDVNDFDETYPGPFEWDVKRLAASLAVAARGNEFGRKRRRRIVRGAVASYREAMARFAGMRELQVWYARADLDELGPQLTAQLRRSRRRRLSRAQARARAHDSVQATRRLTTVVGGDRRFIADPPLLVPVADLMPAVDRDRLAAQVRGLLDRYRRSLQADRRHLLGAFEFVDLARKVVGVGSVGTRCWVVLLHGRDDGDPLLLQVKEAQPSVLARHLAAPHGRRGPEGERVVTGQRLMQAASDIFLGWADVDGIDGQRRDFFVRQLRDWKGSAVVTEMDADAMGAYGRLCGWTLARAHARSGDRIAIAAYLGADAAFEHALADFAEWYADVTEADHTALAAAVRDGRIAAETGV